MENFSSYVLKLFYGCLDLSQYRGIILYLGLLLEVCWIASAHNATFQSFVETLCSLMSLSKSNLIYQLSFEILWKNFENVNNQVSPFHFCEYFQYSTKYVFIIRNRTFKEKPQKDWLEKDFCYDSQQIWFEMWH